MDTHYCMTSNYLLLVIRQHVKVLVARAIHTQQYHRAPETPINKPYFILKALHYSINVSSARGLYIDVVVALLHYSTFGVCYGQNY